MLLGTLKKAKENSVPTTYIHGRKVTEGEPLKKEGKLIVFEQAITEYYNFTPAIFETTVAYDDQPKIYHMRHIEALVIEGYAIFAHIEEPLAIVYKLNSSRENVLVDYQLAAASIFGLDNAKPIAKQDGEGYYVINNDEWEDFLVAMTAARYINMERTAVLQETSVSAF